MASERRQDSRLKRWFDGSWQGASGASRCRLSDVSAKGCFVNSLAEPSVGERTTITIEFDATNAMSFDAEVIYLERTMGFGVKFQDVSAERAAELQRRLDSYKKATA